MKTHHVDQGSRSAFSDPDQKTTRKFSNLGPFPGSNSRPWTPEVDTPMRRQGNLCVWGLHPVVKPDEYETTKTGEQNESFG